MARTLILVRHGESTANRAGSFAGFPDAPLTDLGQRQAEVAADRIAGMQLGPVFVLTSPLRRATHTAEKLASRLGTGVHLDRRLLAGEGRPGQSSEEAGAEVADAIAAAWEVWDGTLVAVSHRFPIRGYLERLLGAPRGAAWVDALGNGEALHLTFDAGGGCQVVHQRWQDEGDTGSG